MVTRCNILLDNVLFMPRKRGQPLKIIDKFANFVYYHARVYSGAGWFAAWLSEQELAKNSCREDP